MRSLQHCCGSACVRCVSARAVWYAAVAAASTVGSCTYQYSTCSIGSITAAIAAPTQRALTVVGDVELPPM